MRRLQAALGGSVRAAAAGWVAPRTTAAFSFLHFVFATADEFPLQVGNCVFLFPRMAF